MTITEETALQAADWFFRLQDAGATPADHLACRAWREADPAHEIAWQRAVGMSQKLGGLPSELAYAALQASKQSDRRRVIKTLAIWGAAGGLGWQGWHSEPARLHRAEYTTHTAERRKIVLNDGTEIYLNTASGINTHFDDKQRLIALEAGEVMIATGKDDPLNRPLVIATAFGQIKPLGTRFAIKQAAEQVALSVMEGSVEIITTQGLRYIVDAGQQTRFDHNSIDSSTALSANADSWVRGVLLVREMPLADFANELARYRNGIIRCAPEVAELKVSGAFQLRDTDRLLASLPTILPINVRYLTRYFVMLSAADV